MDWKTWYQRFARRQRSRQRCDATWRNRRTLLFGAIWFLLFYGGLSRISGSMPAAALDWKQVNQDGFVKNFTPDPTGAGTPSTISPTQQPPMGFFTWRIR